LAHYWYIAKYPESAILIVAEAERCARMEFWPPVRSTMVDVRSSQMVQRVILPASALALVIVLCGLGRRPCGRFRHRQ